MPLSLFMNHLRSGMSLSQNEAQHARGQIPQLEADIFRMQRDISRVRMLLEDLELKQRAKKEELAACQSLFAPVRRLPAEILGEIFIHCLPTEGYVRPDPQCAPFIFGQVCLKWRNVAANTPALWTSFSTDSPRIKAHTHPDFAPLVAGWFLRSGVLPLELAVVHKLSRNVQHRLIPYVPRLRKLLITLPAAPTFFLSSQSLSFPNLEELTVLSKSMLTPVFDRSYTLDAPKLRRVTIFGDVETLSWLPWKQITHVTFHGEDICQDIVEVLPLCGKLEELCFAPRVDGEDDDNEHVPVHPEPIVLPNLKKWQFLMERGDAFIFEALLGILVMPKLRTFELVRGYEWPHSLFMSMISRSSCPIEDLSIDIHDTITEEKQAEIIQALPRLKNFRIRCWDDPVVVPRHIELLRDRQPEIKMDE